MNRIRTLLLLCSAALASPALAATDAVCWNRDTERMDFYSNPPTRGDNNFFSFTVSGTANVTMLYPATASTSRVVRFTSATPTTASTTMRMSDTISAEPRSCLL